MATASTQSDSVSHAEEAARARRLAERRRDDAVRRAQEGHRPSEANDAVFNQSQDTIPSIAANDDTFLPQQQPFGPTATNDPIYRSPGSITSQAQAYEAQQALIAQQRAANDVTYGPKAPPPETVQMNYDAAKKKIKRHKNTSFILIYVLAITAEILDALMAAYGFNAILFFFSFILRVVIIIFVWIKLSFTRRWILRIFIIFLEFIPIIRLLPLTLFMVLYTHSRLRKDAKKSKHRIKELKKRYAFDDQNNE